MTLPAEQLVELLNRWQRRKIVVVGDFMLDRYLYGDADRLSPDAPVPVLTAREQRDSPGGAANVCLDLLALHCDVACVGVIGRDDDGRQLKHQLTEAGCHATGLIAAAGKRPTTVKHNFVGLAQHRHPQKMFRVDYEDHSPIDDKTAERVVSAAKRQLRGAAALCIEDYNKGVLTDSVCSALIKAARDANVPVLVDPAAIDDYSKYAGATCITPNRTEASLATGRDNGDDLTMARQLLRKLKLDTIVLTLDKHGALLLRQGGKPIRVPTVARAVYDVTGAGDMVLAMLAAAIANDADWTTAVRLANVAAGLEVERFGVVPIELSEVLLAILKQQHDHLGKQRTVDQLVPELQAYRRQGRKIAFTNGCFDILHAGHVSYLREARKQGDLLVVALNSDDSIRRIKGEGRPVNHQDDRLLVMSELESVDYVIVFDEDTPIDLIRAIKPDALVKGADYRKSEVVGAKDVESFGGKVKLVPLVKGRSTTNIIGKIKGANGNAG